MRSVLDKQLDHKCVLVLELRLHEIVQPWAPRRFSSQSVTISTAQNDPVARNNTSKPELRQPPPTTRSATAPHQSTVFPHHNQLPRTSQQCSPITISDCPAPANSVPPSQSATTPHQPTVFPHHNQTAPHQPTVFPHHNQQLPRTSQQCSPITISNCPAPANSVPPSKSATAPHQSTVFPHHNQRLPRTSQQCSPITISDCPAPANSVPPSQSATAPHQSTVFPHHNQQLPRTSQQCSPITRSATAPHQSTVFPHHNQQPHTDTPSITNNEESNNNASTTTTTRAAPDCDLWRTPLTRCVTATSPGTAGGSWPARPSSSP